MMKRLAVALLTLAVVAAGCSAPQPSTDTGGRPAEPPRAAAPKRITLGIARDLPVLRSQLARVAASALPGARELEQLVHAGLAIADERGDPHPQLAQTMPTLENGLWTLLPDGRMQITWQIRPGARWQDGTPFTADDIVFTAKVGQDPELPQFRNIAFDSLERVEAVDSATIRLTWRAPYIAADYLFGGFEDLPSLPLPRHLLETSYLENKAGFQDLSYWSVDFVGAGPYKVTEWEHGSHMVLAANDDYAPGRPKIDEIVVRIIVDPQGLLVNILAGAVDMPLQGRFSLQEILQVRDQWRDGHVEIVPASSVKLFPQLRTPNPVAIADLRFRRALLQALDRGQMAEGLMGGLSSVAHSTLVPGTPAFDILEASAVRYEYDGRRAAETILSFGYVAGSDGVYRGADGTKLTIEVRADAIDTLQSAALATVDSWQRLGIAAEFSSTPIQRQGDREYRALFPGFDTTRSAGGFRGFMSFHSSQVRQPENRFTGSNFPGYANPEYDALVERYLTTIPRDERMRVAGQIVHRITDELLCMPLYYSVTSTMIASRLKNVTARVPTDYTVTWNARDWDVSP